MAAGLAWPGAVGAAERVPWTSGRVAGSPHPPAPYAVERLHPARTFRNPVDLAQLPGSDRMVVAEQGGKLWSFDTRSDAVEADLFFDVRQHHQPLDNVLGFTFHPGFATNRHVYLNYNEPGGRPQGAFISRFTVTAEQPPRIDPASEKVILRWLSGGHNGCTLAFGNDGMLYVSTGDADDPDPPDGKRRTGQDVGDLLSSILRLDVDRATGTNGYVVPPDNPFVGMAGARPEIWAFGFRNPWRMSFDRVTGDLWAGDVGWEQWEMVYRVERGGNYGWALTEGPNLRVRTDVRPGPGPILPPVHAVPHSDGASITGGHVYRGSRLPGLRGAYLYGDWETGRFWALRHDGARLVSNEELCDTALKPISFTLDSRGEWIILDYAGGLYQLVPNRGATANAAFPRRLSETGLYASLQPLEPAPGAAPYRIQAPMWNDHATAEWLLAVPGDGAMATSGGVGNIAGGTWFFPSNTVLARTLSLEMEAGEARSRRRVETQLMHWDGQAWQPHSYRWRADGTDADLVPAGGAQDSFMVVDPAAPGGRRETRWRFHSRAECLRCHNAWAGEVLTLNVQQLGLPGGGTEFQRLLDLGLVKRKGALRGKSLVNPHDEAAPLEERVRSWVHVNCATCHRFGAGGAVAIHLDHDRAPRDWRALDVKPARGDFGLPDARILSTVDPFASTLLYRISTEGMGRMPHIGSRLVDERGVAMVREWLAGLGRAGKAMPAAAEREGWSDTRSALRRLAVPGGVPVGEAEVAARHTNLFVRELAARFLPAGQRRETLGDQWEAQAVLGLAGDAARGREVFRGAGQCQRCHQLEGEGRDFGPSLEGLAGRLSRTQVLQAMREPSETIAPEFRTVAVTLRDGSELSGFALRRGPRELVLREETGAERRVAVADVAETRESRLSAMPEGLLAPLTAQEAADLLEYLLRGAGRGR
jgi:putative heme-binding domain-containing protein